MPHRHSSRMELRSHNTQRARATSSTVIQRPPISHVAMRLPRGQRESFPGKLIVPNINIQTHLDVPSVNITPPPAIYTYSHDTSIYIDHHDTDGPGRLDSHIYTPDYCLRQLSVSSYATQFTQRTQSTLQVIPTLTISTTKQHRRRKASFASSTGRTSTPVQFFKRCLRRGSIPGGDNIDAELESQVTESPPGFQYAATPSVGIPVSSRDSDQLVPLSVRYMHPPPSQLFAQSKTLIRALEDWNEHFKNPPPHWIINFVPKAYLRRGWHLAEEVAEYLHTYGLNVGVDSNGITRCAWKVEYEAIGHKACLVDEGGKSHVTEGYYYTDKNPNQNLLVWGEGFRERHPSRCWERKEGWDGCRGLVIGLAL
ncbi:hypothetical protein L211DRAFT_137091 [Terfezia boudieri ATCC MYA-4762]|uniref:Uncharacterized protein n=1 Tax=Terfezia boudieri ATCC MYA-4762 TaxID=1051890 RepID=A0A3N4LQI0_9PEZI|nr:hypothetical protein L211DRAFT_137091 [Terfezia boudieri ATCC MYA-4762]